jgi:Rod binding domain-containing protein
MSSSLDFPGTLAVPPRLATGGTPSAALPRSSAAAGDATGARKSAEDFTAFFLSQSLESMYAGMEPNSLFGGGNGETVYRSLMLQEYGKVMARSDGLGIVDAVQRQILHLQETAT